MKKMSVFLGAAAAAAVGLLAGCTNTYDYYNPLDPREDAPLELVLPFVESVAIQSAIEQYALDEAITTKYGIENVRVFDAQVTSLRGLEYFSRIRWLELNFVRLVPNGVDLTPLTKMQGLEYINLMNNEFDPGSIDRIPHLPRVNGMSLGFNPIGDANILLPLLSQYRRAQLNLDLQNTQLEMDTIEALNPVLDRLWGLNLARINSASPLSDLNFLVPNDTITTLDLNQVPGLTDVAGLINLQGLEWLDLSFNTGLTDGIEVLLNLPQLETAEFVGSDLAPLAVLDQLAASGVTVYYPDGSISNE